MRRPTRPWRTVLVTALLLLRPALGIGQVTITVGPITTNDKVEWTVATATSAAEAQGIELRMRDNSTSGPYVVVPNPVCVALTPTGGYRCTAPVPAALAAVVNTRGVHNLIAYAAQDGVEGSAALPFRLDYSGSCTDKGVTYPVGTGRGERNQLSTLNHAARVAELYKGGWQVESHREQYKDPSTPTNSDGGYWWVLYFCR